MRRILFLICWTAFTTAGLYAGDTIPASDSHIEYTGRIDFTDPLGPEFSYSGISIRASFTGSQISAVLDDELGENYYNIILDGVVRDTLHGSAGKTAYLLAEGLGTGSHEIEIFRRTELTFGKTTFYGFILEEGDSLEEISNVRGPVIEYIGNSITCGYGNEGRLGETFGPETENHYLSYAAITSRNFNARHMAVSRSGIGIYRNYDGPPEGNADCMPNLYNRIFLYDEEPLYDFSLPPDVVCINLGTNDFSTVGGDSALYVHNYLRLIDSVQHKYDMPRIVCLIGPMLSGGTLTEVREYVQFVADSAGSKGMGDVTRFELSPQGALGYGVDYHPTVAQHEKNAAELTTYLKELTTWKMEALIKKANTLDENHLRLQFNTAVQDPQGSYGGFALYSNENPYTIQELYRDPDDPSILHLITEQNISPGENISLDYIPGTVESGDTVAMKRFIGFPVNNLLNR